MKFSDIVPVISDLPPSETVVMLGAPGIGKSSVGEAVAKEMQKRARAQNGDAPPVVFHPVDLSSKLPEDIGGLPFRDGNVTEYCPTAWVHDLCKPGAYGVLLLDDLPAATQAVQVACRQIALDRRVHRHIFSPGIRVIVTGNRREDKSAASQLPAHFRNSSVMLQLQVDTAEWRTYAAQAGGVHAAILGYVTWKPSNLSRLPKDQDAETGAFATPRSWMKLAKCMPTALKHDRVLDVAAGLVGTGVATEFKSFLDLFNEFPDPAAILEHPETAPRPDAQRPDKTIAMVTAVADFAGRLCCPVGGGRRPAYAEQVKIFAKTLRALAVITNGHREFSACGFSAFLACGDLMPLLMEAAGIAQRDPAVRDLVESLGRTLQQTARP